MLTNKIVAPLLAIVAALVVGGAGNYAADLERNRVMQMQRHDAMNLVGKYRAAIEGELNASLYMANSLIAYVMTHDSLENEPGEVIKILKIIKDNGRHTRNIGLAPNNRIKYIYPIEDNKAALGLKYEDIPDQWPTVERSIKERRPILAGPIQLKQGGRGLVYRVPVFMEPQGKYWGMLSMVLDEKSLFDQVRISPESDGLQLALRGKDGKGSEGDTFLGDPALFDKDAIKAAITTPGGSWEIAVRPLQGWDAFSHSLWIRIGAWVAAILLGGLLFHTVQAVLKRLQAEKSLKLILDTEPECVKVLAQDGTMLQMNRAGLEMVEAESDEQVLGRNVIGFVAPEYREAFVALEQQVNSGESAALTFESIGLKGGRRWLESMVTPLRDTENCVTGMLAVTRDVSVQKKLEISLKETALRLQEAQRLAQLGSWELEVINNHLTWSDEIYKIFEIDPAKTPASYEVFLATIHPEDRDRVDHVYRNSLASGDPYEITHRLLMPDGRIKHVHERCETIYDPDGKPLRSMGTIQDVTLRVLAEESIKESEERFRTVADHTYDWEYWRGPQKEFLYMSPSCLRVTGYTQSEFLADLSLIEHIIHPDDRKYWDDHLVNYQDATDHTLDFRIVRKDGEVRWIAHGCRPVYGQNGAFLGRRISNRDITERKHVEEALHESEERFRLISEFAKDAIIMVNSLEEITYWNHAAENVFGYAMEEAIGKQLHSLLAPQRLQVSARQGFEEFIASGTGKLIGTIFETQALKKDGTEFPVELSVSALRMNGQWNAIGIVRDITDRKAAAEVIHRMAFYDTLTGLPNRRLFEDRLHQLAARGKRTGLRFALLFIDLDNFKPINDTMGHEVGDWLLQAVAQRISGSLRESDTAARIGGDEFVVLLPDVSCLDDVMGIAEKIRHVVQKTFVTPLGLPLEISASIGGALYPDHADNERDLLRAGDAAMYQAKQSGRNGVVLYRPPAISPNEARQTLSEQQSFVHLTWKDEYACGEPTIDNQHRELIRLSNHLLDEASKPGAKKEEVIAALEMLQSHVREHFAHEESILQSHQYDQAEAHAEKHKQLLSRMHELQQQIEESGVSIGELTSFLVSDVVAEHLLREDKKFFNTFLLAQ